MILLPLLLGALLAPRGDDAPSAACPSLSSRLEHVGGAADSGVGGLAVSADGQVLAFASDADELAAGDDNGRRDVLVLDRASGRLLLASADADGRPGPAPSSEPSLSADGTRLAFTSFSALDAADRAPFGDVFVRDLPDGEVRRVSLGPGGGAANGTSRAPTLSADGRLLVFQSWADDLVPGDENGACDVFLHDLATGVTRCLSVGADGRPADGPSRSPTLSGDGRWAAWATAAPALTRGATGEQLVLLDLTLGTHEVLAALPDGPDPNPSLDRAGRRLAWTARAPKLAAAGATRPAARPADQLWIFDRADGRVERLSTGDQGPADGGCGHARLSADGRLAAFHGRTTNLTDAPADGRDHLHLRDLAHDRTLLIDPSPRASTPRASAGDVLDVALSADGSTLVFCSTAPRLVADDDDEFADVFVLEL